MPRARLATRVATRPALVCGALGVGIVIIAAVTLTTGDYPVPLDQVLAALRGAARPGPQFIIEQVRAPRLCCALAVGGCLGLGGCLFQSLSRNPLGSPDIVGFDTGAATGALLVILAGHGSVGATATGAVAGGLTTGFIVYVLAARAGVRGLRIVLVGIGVAAMLTSVNSYLLQRANIVDAQAANVWLTGSLSGRGWAQASLAAGALALTLGPAMVLARGLAILEMGDDSARALGVRPEATRFTAVVVGVSAAAAATAAAGPIAFVALAAPQIARRGARTSGPGVTCSTLTGALLLAAADLAAQRILPGAGLPVGVATGVLGGLYLTWLLAQRRRRSR